MLIYCSDFIPYFKIEYYSIKNSDKIDQILQNKIIFVLKLLPIKVLKLWPLKEML